MKIERNNFRLLMILSLILATFVVYGRVTAEQVEPGSDKDPIVTKSYVESQINPLRDSINKLTAFNNTQSNNAPSAQISDKVNDLAIKTKYLIDTNNELVKKIKDLDARLTAASSKSPAFKLSVVPANKLIYLGEGSQLILRSGKIVSYSNQKSGFSDITAGIDTTNGQQLGKNHLIVCPKADTRYLKTQMESYVLISGNYQIK